LLYTAAAHPYVTASHPLSKEDICMRAETQNLVDEIKQGVTLLRRHL